jgi:two-component sensor histidine kinase
MKLNATLADFLRSDPDYEPFGLSWLRGLTLARVGLVAGVCLLVLVRAYSTDFFQDKPPQIVDWATYLMLDTAQWLRNVFPALLLVTVADNLSEEARTPVRVISLAAAIVMGAWLAGAMAWFVSCSDEIADCRMSVARCFLAEFFAGTGSARYCFLNIFFTTLSWGALLTGALSFLERERRMAAATQRASLERIDLDRQMAEARLQVLQAQIEPHFLFNSLATILGLYRQDAREGSRLIKDLADYLRGALPQMRETVSTLRRELTLSQAYLRVLQVRMGNRLKVEIDVPRRLQEASVPPMMLPTLVENAVKHGIAPAPKGGTVHIRAEQMGTRLRVAVSDDGAGFRHTSGAGVGLANLRARLATLFGTDASLDVVANVDAGVTATLELPLRAVQRPHGPA